MWQFVQFPLVQVKLQVKRSHAAEDLQAVKVFMIRGLGLSLSVSNQPTLSSAQAV
jgi:hypothetical protein